MHAMLSYVQRTYCGHHVSIQWNIEYHEGWILYAKLTHTKKISNLIFWSGGIGCGGHRCTMHVSSTLYASSKSTQIPCDICTIFFTRRCHALVWLCWKTVRRSKCTLTLSSIMLIHTHCILIELYVPFYHIFSFAAMPERSIFFSSWPTSTTSENVWRNMHERHASDGASHSLSLSLVLYGSDVANLTVTQICFLFSSSFFCFSLGGTLNCGEKWCGPNQKNGYAYIQTVCVWHAVLHRSPKDFLVRSSSLLCTWNDCGWRCSVQDTLPSDNVDFRTTRK